jgi:hypothetical protein
LDNTHHIEVARAWFIAGRAVIASSVGNAIEVKPRNLK